MLMKEKNDLIKPTLILAFLLITLAVMLITGYMKTESLWFIFPFSGIRISTLVAAIVCFALVLFLQRKKTLKSVYYASLAVIFALGLFEILWYYSAAAYKAWDLRIFQFAALAGWILLGVREVYRTRPPKISIIFYVLFVVSFLVWLAIGLPFNISNGESFSVPGEILNELSKTALFFAFGFHIGAKK
jgi:hypothetical protein